MHWQCFLCENDRFGIIIISKRIVYMWFTAKVMKRKKRTPDGFFLVIDGF